MIKEPLDKELQAMLQEIEAIHGQQEALDVLLTIAILHGRGKASIRDRLINAAIPSRCRKCVLEKLNQIWS